MGTHPRDIDSAYTSPTFDKDSSFHVDRPVGSMSISPCGRDVVLASRQGLHIVDLDSPWTPPRHLPHLTPWEVADVQWSPFSSRDYWVVSTSNQKALVWNLAMSNPSASIEHVLHAHTRAITDINFSAHHPDLLATCAVDSFVHCWDLRFPARPAITFCDWFAGATQVKWNRQEGHIIASSHDKMLRVWDDRKGAYPLRSITAHDTKIYGIDWNRTDSTCLATCSLDRTIKFWNYEDPKEVPDSVIRTPFPVWRARHTPFGHGLLAMPQRGDFNVHLYDSRTSSSSRDAGTVDSVRKFTGHENQVKEFLWRSRGRLDAGIDDREFQLVTWGTDLSLRLHRMTDDDMGRVGFVRGASVDQKMAMTRRDAQYRTFRDEPGRSLESPSHDASTPDDPYSATAGFDYYKTSLGTIAPSPSTALGGWMSAGFVNTRSGIATNSSARKDLAPISWMKGVKIGKREANVEQSIASVASPELKTHRGSEEFESLGEEITHVGSKFTKVEFSLVDIQKRFVRLSMHGPWAENHAMTYLNCQVRFPEAYPHGTSPTIAIEQTASLPDATITKLQDDAKKIGHAYQSHNRSSFEAQVRYLQGEQTLDDIIAWTKDDTDTSIFGFGSEEASSSDDEDELGAFVGKQDSEAGLTGSGLLSVSNANANVPLAQTCGAVWSADGRLVCFFKPKRDELPTSLVGSLGLDDPASLSKFKKKGYERFGKLHSSSRRSKTSSYDMIGSDDSDSDIYSDSSDYSSNSSISAQDLESRHNLSLQSGFRIDVFPFQQAGKLTDEAQRSTASLSVARSGNTTAESLIAMHDVAHLLPSKKELAKRYVIEGPGAFLHNSRVAADLGLMDLAEVWVMIDMILKNQVPLQTVPVLDLKEPEGLPISVPLTRVDSGVHLSDAVASERELKASVKWGCHPFGRAFLIQQLFRHFSQLADIQMLALMTCIFSTATPSPIVPTDADHIGQISPQKSFRQPLSSVLSSPSTASPNRLEYFPSVEVAFSVLMPNASKTVTISSPSRPRVDSVSLSSSVGASGGDIMTGFAPSLTPPLSFKSTRKSFDQQESAVEGLSSSPEKFKWSYRSSSQSAGMLSSSFQRTFFSASASSSPPNPASRKKISPAGSFGGVVASTQPASLSLQRHMSRSLSNTDRPRQRSVPEEAARTANPSQKQVFNYKTSLKNQDQFYNDGYSDVPLLVPEEKLQYDNYRLQYAELLGAWGLFLERATILKCNNSCPQASSAGMTDGSQTTCEIAIGRHKPGQSHPQFVQIRRACPVCGHATALGWTSGGSCVNCRSRSSPAVCVLCEEEIAGLASPCLACGHVLHSACRGAAAELRHDTDASCISGCGCDCDDYSLVPDHMVEAAEPLSRAPSLRRMNGGAVERHEVVTDEREDVAYQSLKKNLGGLGRGKARAWKGRSRSSSAHAA